MNGVDKKSSRVSIQWKVLTKKVATRQGRNLDFVLVSCGFDEDTSTWSACSCFSSIEKPRKGSALREWPGILARRSDVEMLDYDSGVTYME